MKRAFLVPEVLQTSLMDCGPAALKAVLQGFGIDVHYEWLRDRCQTDVDGTSIDALAALGQELGLATAEMVVPHDSFLLPEADCLPAIVVKRGAGNSLHFVVVWRRLGPLVQILDPGSGRRWVRCERFMEDMPHFPIPISIDRWRRWVSSEGSLGPLRAKLRALGVQGEALIRRADADPGWRSFAALDAAVRMAARLVRGGAISRGGEAQRVLDGVFDRALAGEPGAIPKGFFWATEGKAPGKLLVHGAVIVHFAPRGGAATAPAGEATAPAGKVSALAGEASGPAGEAARAAAPAARATALATRAAAPPPGYRDSATPSVAPAEQAPRAVATAVLPAPVRRELELPSPSPSRLFFWMLRADAGRALALLGVALAASAAIAAIDVVVLRGLFDAVKHITVEYQRALGLLALVAFAAGGLLLELFVARAVSRLGRALEVRFRAAFLEKLPRLEDRYLRSRPTSDMTARGHAMHLMREAPALFSRIARAALSFAATLLGVLWLYPGGAWLSLVAAAVALAAPYLARRPLVESLMRLRTHAASLERFYLDALLGVVPIRVHGAERAVRREHEALLVEWARTGRLVHAQSTAMQAAQGLASTAVAVAIVGGYVASGGPPAALLLLVFWSLRLPAAAQELVAALLGWKNVRNVSVRLFAPLAAPEVDLPRAPATCGDGAPGEELVDGAPGEERGAEGARGAAIDLRGVSVQAGGHTLLSDVSLSLPGGAHIAVVGSSGAGKSSLLSLLLGWVRASRGEVLVDGRPLDGAALARLRRGTAWVDPAIQLWNRTLLENLTFGHAGDALARVPLAMGQAELTDVLEGLPDGLQAAIGEGGARLSGGQGQRVRLGRALMKGDARLVLLDEPFRGLERERRRALLARAREHWRGATLLFVSHDVMDTVGFDRVLVIEGGKVVEDGAPRELLDDPRSRYRALADADARARDDVWSKGRFRSATMASGRLVEEAV
ncbi:ATP-binding cassette domain-containing protein [Sorangium sp. So ce513]|uniref:ATP-binding cassette domain-containing protein n=1 Tax=Sorangium sp. So ce513 TaxID=3133315 RepID=UPI003F60AA34